MRLYHNSYMTRLRWATPMMPAVLTGCLMLCRDQKEEVADHRDQKASADEAIVVIFPAFQPCHLRLVHSCVHMCHVQSFRNFKLLLKCLL
jgi:hypothetical protein